MERRVTDRDALLASLATFRQVRAELRERIETIAAERLALDAREAALLACRDHADARIGRLKTLIGGNVLPFHREAADG